LSHCSERVCVCQLEKCRQLNKMHFLSGRITAEEELDSIVKDRREKKVQPRTPTSTEHVFGRDALQNITFVVFRWVVEYIFYRFAPK